MDILSLTLCVPPISQYSSPCIRMLINNCRQRNPSQTTEGSHPAILLWQGIYFRSFQPNLIVHMLSWGPSTSQNLGTVNTGCQQCVQIPIGDIRWFYPLQAIVFVVGPTLIATCQEISSIFNTQYDCEGGQCGHTVSNTGIQTVVGVGRKLIHFTHGNILSTLTHFTTCGDSMKSRPGTSLNLCRTSQASKTFITRWQESCRRETPSNVLKQRRG